MNTSLHGDASLQATTQAAVLLHQEVSAALSEASRLAANSGAADPQPGGIALGSAAHYALIGPSFSTNRAQLLQAALQRMVEPWETSNSSGSGGNQDESESRVAGGNNNTQLAQLRPAVKGTMVAISSQLAALARDVDPQVRGLVASFAERGSARLGLGGGPAATAGSVGQEQTAAALLSFVVPLADLVVDRESVDVRRKAMGALCSVFRAALSAIASDLAGKEEFAALMRAKDRSILALSRVERGSLIVGDKPSVQVCAVNLLQVLALAYSLPEGPGATEGASAVASSQFHLGLVPNGHRVLRSGPLREEGERCMFELVGALSGSVPGGRLLRLPDSSSLMCAVHAAFQLARQRPQWLIHIIPALLKFHARLSDVGRSERARGRAGSDSLELSRNQVPSVRYLLKHTLQQILKIRGSHVVSEWADAISDVLNELGVRQKSLAARLSHKRGTQMDTLTVEGAAAKRQRAMLSAAEQERMQREEHQKQLGEIRQLFSGVTGQPSLLQLLLDAHFDANMISGLILQNYSMFDLIDPPRQSSDDNSSSDVVFPSQSPIVRHFNETIGRLVGPLKTDAEQLQQQQLLLRQQQELELERHATGASAVTFEPKLPSRDEFIKSGSAAAAASGAWSRLLAGASGGQRAPANLSRVLEAARTAQQTLEAKNGADVPGLDPRAIVDVAPAAGSDSTIRASPYVPTLGLARMLASIVAGFPLSHPMLQNFLGFILANFRDRRIFALEWLLAEAAAATGGSLVPQAASQEPVKDEDKEPTAAAASDPSDTHMTASEPTTQVGGLNAEELADMRVPQLRALCLKRDLDAKGVKSALIERLLAQEAENTGAGAEVVAAAAAAAAATARAAIPTPSAQTGTSAGLRLNLILSPGPFPPLETWEENRRERYSSIAMSLLSGLYTALEPSDRDFSFLYRRAPVLPVDGALKLLERACREDALLPPEEADAFMTGTDEVTPSAPKNSPRVGVSLGILRDLILERPAYRDKALTLLLQLTLSPIDKVRDISTRLVSNQLFMASWKVSETQALIEGEVIAPPQAPSGEEMLRISDHIRDHSAAAFDWAFERALDSSTGAELSDDARVGKKFETLPAGVGDVLDVANVSDDDIKRHLMLYLTLTIKDPDMLPAVARAYAAVGAGDDSVSGPLQLVKRIATAQVSQLCRQLGGTHRAVLELVKNYPPGAESLVLRALSLLSQFYVSSGDARPPAELVSAVLQTFLTRSRDARFLVPILAGMQREHIEGFLPELLTLPNEFLTSWVNTLIFNTQTISATQLLIALHMVTTDNGRDAQARVLQQTLRVEGALPAPRLESSELVQPAVHAVGVCFDAPQIFTPQTLAAVLQRLVDAQPVPPLFMRTLIMMCGRYQKLKAFAVQQLLGKLLTRRVWLDRKLWEGWMRAARVLFPASLPVLRQLPQHELREMLHAYPDIVTMQPDLAMGMRH